MSGVPGPLVKGLGMRFNPHLENYSLWALCPDRSLFIQDSVPYKMLPVEHLLIATPCVRYFTYVIPLNALVGPEMSKFSSQFYW